MFKLSYAAWLERWDWMIGTGLYIEDAHQEVASDAGCDQQEY